VTTLGWIAFGVAVLCALVLGHALCRVAADADRRIEAMQRRLAEAKRQGYLEALDRERGRAA
jgi:type IV secretory pathway TrbD component